MLYQVVCYCHILPMWEVKASGLKLEEAEKIALQLENEKKYKHGKMDCCRYFVQLEDENNDISY